jgi:nucleolar protein 9
MNPSMKRRETGLMPEEHQRPRRPNTDTITYLRSLPLDVTVATEEITNFLSGIPTPTPTRDSKDKGESEGENNGEPEYPATLIAALSALDEIRHEIASLAGEEKAAECIEVLAHITAPYSELAARKLLYSCSGYALHLATHRYGSHVLQTLLQLAVTSKNDGTDMALHEDAPQRMADNSNTTQEDLPSLTDLLLGLLEELTPHATELAMHICGSHVLRTLCCVLGGVQVHTERPGGQSQIQSQSQIVRRGKSKSKKKKKKRPAPPLESAAQQLRMSYLVGSRISSSSSNNHLEIQQSLQKLTEAVSGSQVRPPGDLQQLACHPSGGPLLILLLRVLTYSSADEEQRAQFQKTAQETKSVDHHLNIMEPEPTFVAGSAAHALAERLLCIQQTQREEQPWVADVIYGMAGELRGSHVLETLLRLSPDDLYASILEHGGFTTKATLEEYVQHDVSNFVVQTVLATLRNKDQVEAMLSAVTPLVTSGFVIDVANKRRGILWRLVEMAVKYKIGQDKILEAIKRGFATLQGEKVPATSLAAVISSLLSLQKAENDGERLQLDVAGTRTVFQLLRFEPHHCKVVLKGILALSPEDIEAIAKDGLGSRCILDGILDNPSGDSVFTKAVKQLLLKLQDRWVALSVDRIGHHTTKKVFRALDDMGSREELVQELVEGTNRLTGNAMGRSVVDACSVREYTSKGQDQWRKTVQKTLEREEWLKEMVSKDTTHKRDDTERKRQGSDLEPASKKSRKADGVTLDSIMEAISIPAEAKR